ncbi:hypothetical protein HYPSUDRAFT_209521 [Hypholoma sublateritium FD-334 SS-4]|uniref:Uncharacterized protein n=1 Tax=Hypholoma sublateritium (strain FD-334 SS-4) TaxID=945553 RepID=A0A0D2NYA2_HYPSF|nr:hypothetical protein HYPSUDRAFT_209521 [Hypholoma sublateritium FD-334 SS-4]
MAPSTRQNFVVAPVNRPLDGGQLHEEEEEFSEDENIDPPSYTQPRPQIGMVPVGFVTVRLPLNSNVFCDVDFQPWLLFSCINPW